MNRISVECDLAYSNHFALVAQLSKVKTLLCIYDL